MQFDLTFQLTGLPNTLTVRVSSPYGTSDEVRYIENALGSGAIRIPDVSGTEVWIRSSTVAAFTVTPVPRTES